MGVRASMSLSIVRHGQLWGMIACHHRTPRQVPYAMRSACEVFAQMISLQFEAQEQAEDFAATTRQRKIQEALVQVMAREADLALGLIKYRPNLLDFIASEGVALVIEGRYSAIGRTPEEPAVRALAAWLAEQKPEGVVALDRLPELYPPARDFVEVGSGVLALAVSRDPRDTILWFRPEVLQTVTWAGNPNKPVESGPEGARLSPRRSFAAWQETVRGRSRPWTAVEVGSAAALRVSLLEVVLRRLDEVARERANAKERQDFLMAELDHRVKNTLANIQALVRHSSGGAASLEGFVVEFGRRLQAMAKAHSLLAHSRWEGADLRALIEEELRAHRGEAPCNLTRFQVGGPELRLKPKAALALSLALHELATNAAKYGALSVPAGRLRIDWRLSGEQMVLDWVESHGPPVPPQRRRGFGSTVIERGLAYEIGGLVTLDFDPAGLRCRVEMPLRQIVDASALLPLVSAQAAIAGAARPRQLAGRRVLVVEDALLVAMELEGALADVGIEVVGPAASVDGAVALARTERLDAALLDIDLDGTPVFPVAEALLARAVPFVFTTGYEAATILPQRFRGGPVLPKPFTGAQAVEVLRRLFAAEA
ncbi:MAG: HWE histidine kinase domain-containing protein, partial [Paracraurococcus sp.]